MKNLVVLLVIFVATILNGQGKVDRCDAGTYLSHNHAVTSIKKNHPKFYQEYRSAMPFLIEVCRNGRHGLSKQAESLLSNLKQEF